MSKSLITLPEFAGIAITIILTFLLHAVFAIPRMMAVFVGMHFLWDERSSPAPIAVTLYLFFDFIFGLLSGMLAVAGCRLMLPRARMSVICFFAAIVALAYALVTVVLKGRLPSFFFPTYLDVAAALPAWLIAYYFAGGADVRENLGIGEISVLTTSAITVIAVVVITPSYLPFYTESVTVPRVPQSFQPVPEMNSSGANSDMPSFHTMPQPNPP